MTLGMVRPLGGGGHAPVTKPDAVSPIPGAHNSHKLSSGFYILCVCVCVCPTAPPQ